MSEGTGVTAFFVAPDSATAMDATAVLANLDIGYLLERLEAYRGLAILAITRREYFDDAFARRIRHVVSFE